MSSAQYPNRPQIILGTLNIGDASIDNEIQVSTPEEVKTFLDEFYNRGYRRLNTARPYPPSAFGTSEPRVGQANQDDTLEAMDAFHKEGKFKHLGISNYLPDEVEQIMAICADKQLTPPVAYQGFYNPITREAETELLPVLRKHGIALYAYSPAAGGVFSDEQRPNNRFKSKTMVGNFYMEMYNRPAIKSAVEIVKKVARAHGIPPHNAAMRWVVYHSHLSAAHGDAVVLGASNVEQLRKNLDAIDAGPLPQEVADALSAVGDAVGEENRKAHRFTTESISNM
ncbi:MAG: hypothetical protein STHCBS139747_003827 [Sporothrix thermara]